MDIKILIATHKEYWLPKSDLYLPLHVGSELSDLKMDCQRDDEGENISAKNPNYCELTAIYWAWKNLDAEYIGLVHYRRYLATHSVAGFASDEAKRRCILTREAAEHMLEHSDIIVPRKRNYFIETLFSHYEHTHEGDHLRKVREVIGERDPRYLDAFDQMLERRSAHMFNMFVMKKEKFRAYCEWLFPILEVMEGYVDTSNMTPYEARYMGRISELLLDVWMETNRYSYVEAPVVCMGKTKWPKKIKSFLDAKFKNKKYEQSF